MVRFASADTCGSCQLHAPGPRDSVDSMRYGRARDAFTLIEMLLVIGIMGAVSGLTIPLYRQYAIRNDLSIARGAITQGVDRARALANAGKEGSAWGF